MASFYQTALESFSLNFLFQQMLGAWTIGTCLAQLLESSKHLCLTHAAKQLRCAPAANRCDSEIFIVPFCWQRGRGRRKSMKKQKQKQNTGEFSTSTQRWLWLSQNQRAGVTQSPAPWRKLPMAILISFWGTLSELLSSHLPLPASTNLCQKALC